MVPRRLTYEEIEQEIEERRGAIRIARAEAAEAEVLEIIQHHDYWAKHPGQRGKIIWKGPGTYYIPLAGTITNIAGKDFGYGLMVRYGSLAEALDSGWSLA